MKRKVLLFSFMASLLFWGVNFDVQSGCPQGETGLCIYVNGSPNTCGNNITSGKGDCGQKSGSEA